MRNMKQVSVFIENKKASLTEVTKILYDVDVNIISFSVADTESYGLFRMIVSDSDRAVEALKEKRISASQTDVTAVKISNEKGKLHQLVTLIQDFDIQYLYVFLNGEKVAGVILKITEREEAEKLILRHGYELLDESVLK